MNLILEKTDRVAYFTDMKSVFAALEISAADYDWYLSDIDTNRTPAGLLREDHRLAGEALQHLLENHDIQFNWAVFSAVPKGVSVVVPSTLRISAEADFWSGNEVRPQLPGALFEIVCWDSSATILVELPAEAEAAFVRNYPETRQLGCEIS
jgi:hypothetical protein